MNPLRARRRHRRCLPAHRRNGPETGVSYCNMRCRLMSVISGNARNEPMMSDSLIGRLGSSTFRLFTAAVSMSPAGSRFSSESALGPFHHGIRGRGGTIFPAALPLDERQVQADMRTHLIHRPREGHHSAWPWQTTLAFV